MEPDAVNKLAEEAEDMKKEVLALFPGKLPSRIKHLFGDMSIFFDEEVISEWRRQERFDELIEYILYQYDERGGEEIWQQVLLDLRIKNDEIRANKLLDGLYLGRAELFWVALKNSNEHPDNHFSAANLAKARGEVMKVLYEQAFIAENKPEEEQDTTQVEKVRSKIQEILSGEKVT